MRVFSVPNLQQYTTETVLISPFSQSSTDNFFRSLLYYTRLHTFTFTTTPIPSYLSFHRYKTLRLLQRRSSMHMSLTRVYMFMRIHTRIIYYYEDVYGNDMVKHTLMYVCIYTCV